MTNRKFLRNSGEKFETISDEQYILNFVPYKNRSNDFVKK